MADLPLPVRAVHRPVCVLLDCSWQPSGRWGAKLFDIAQVTQSAGWMGGGVGARVTHAGGGGGAAGLQGARMPLHAPASRGSHYLKLER